jgi:hypothetical protein
LSQALVYAVHELGGVAADDFDLAERRGVEQADGVARRLALPHHRSALVLARLGEIPGAPPERDILERRAMLGCPVVDRRFAHGIEQNIARRTNQRAERDRRIGRSRRRRPHFRNWLFHRSSDQADGVHVRRLALVGRHARRRVALDVLDRFEALAQRKLDIFGRHVVLKIDEGLEALRVVVRRQRSCRLKTRKRCGGGKAAVAHAPGRGSAGGEAFGETGGEIICTPRGARRAHGPRRAIWYESVDRGLETQLAA